MRRYKRRAIRIIVQYLQHYKNSKPKPIPETLSGNDLRKEIVRGDFEFIDGLSYENAFHLIKVMNYIIYMI